MSLALPPLDGRLDLKGLLGQGGMGQVHRAWDRALERAVAVKFLRGTDAEQAERLLLEARLQARVEHPAVVRVHEVGTLEGRPCIVMQLVEGGTLGDLGPEVPLATRLELLREAALGLHAAHLQGLIHRDVKPGNILVEGQDGGTPHALVSDFGLARDEEGGLTRSGLPAGTLEYMAPEVLLGTGPIDFRVDIYSLGAAAYAILSGTSPFRATAADRSGGESGQATAQDGGARLLQRILESDPAPLTEVPADLRTIVAKAMEKAPVDRYASAEAFAEDIGRFLRGEAIHARPATRLDRLLKWGRRNPTAARASLAAALTVVLGLGYGVWTTRRAAAQSLDAARMGALAESFEARARQEALSPAHDLRPLTDHLRAEAERLRAAGRRNGPAAFARGRALELLGEWGPSLEAYRWAWAAGYRTPQTAEALGLALIRVYDQDLRRARASLAPKALERRKAELDRDLAGPARALLPQGDPRGWRRAWAEVVLRMLDGDFEGARALARSIRERDPQRYEAWTLEAEVGIAEAERRIQERRYQEAGRGLDQARAALDQALAWGRSDTRPRSAMTGLMTNRAALANAAGADPTEATRESLAWIDQALALAPDHPELLLRRAMTLYQQAISPRAGSMADRADLLEQVLRLLDQADARRAGDPRILLATAECTVALSLAQHNLGRPMQATLDRGLATVARVRGLTPLDPTVDRIELFLRHREVLALKRDGRNPEPTLEAGLAAGRRALEREVVNPDPVLSMQINLRMDLGRVVWQRGGDARSIWMEAAEAASALARRPNQDVRHIQVGLHSIAYAADQLTDLEGEVDRMLDMGTEVSRLALALAPDHQPFLYNTGLLRMVEAYWRSIHDQDPGPAAAEARRHFARNAVLLRNPLACQGEFASLAISQARWDLHRGRSPEAALATAEQALKSIAAQAATSSGLQQNLAQVAFYRALWARSRKRSDGDQVARGLSHIARAIELDAGDPGLRVIRARLQTLAGDRSGAQASLDEARKFNPLIARGAEYTRAVAELSGR